MLNRVDLFDEFTPTVLSVTALNNYLRELLETDEVLQDLWVRGEISNFSRPRSGHIYFTLKDSEAQMRCVMWKQSTLRLRFEPQDGMNVEVHGGMSIYAAGGQVQLYVNSMRPAGEGLLYQEFLRLKARLEAEGLFEAEHKRPIPPLPRRIGIVTSATGAALQDMLNTLARRAPSLEVVLASTQVQGTGAAESMIAALAGLNALPDLDLILLGRGGGSIEDLWAFNDEALARAIFASRVPVITGIGHETDFTIADFVSDLRAPTPTAAAELATQVTHAELGAALRAKQQTLDQLIQNQLSQRRQALQFADLELRRLAPQARLNNAIQRQDELRARLDRAIAGQLQATSFRHAALQARLQALDPGSILRRGYAIISDGPTGKLLTSVRQMQPGQAVKLQVSDGAAAATLDQIEGANHDN